MLRYTSRRREYINKAFYGNLNTPHGIATGDSTVNLANKDCEVPFDIFLACLDKRQDS